MHIRSEDSEWQVSLNQFASFRFSHMTSSRNPVNLIPDDSLCAANSNRVTQVRQWQDAGGLLNAAAAATASPSGWQTVILN